ncbi:MAG: fumarylacetoacetate hydrolase family protein [Desulfatibacillum sp.]|nr:fumarylacetoacetate hydrolase family protein [Desulfatibacillum sp.]
MRLVRFGEKGKEKPGLEKYGRIVDLKKQFQDIPDIGREFFEQGWVDKLRDCKDAGETMDVRLGPPITNPSKIICLGKNYAEHAKEGGMSVPSAPLLFCKTPNTVNGPTDPVLMPAHSGQVDWEVELAVVIGKKGKRISRKNALDHVAGLMILNDVSGREAQFGDKQWFRGKSFDTFAPMGPALVTLDEVEDINNIKLEALVNGEVMQQGNTSDLIFDIPTIIEYISQDITLEAGDVISTGTPSGVGIFRDPPIVLNAGDTVICRIKGIGELENVFVAE